ncbi:MAG: hypothetical protein WCS37_19480, partial [Chloroflexota bacterium]
ATPAAFLATGNNRTNFSFGPENASQPSDQYGRLTFETSGPPPHFSLKADSLIIGSEVYQPQSDPRTLGVAVSQIYLKTQPGRLGIIVPPLTFWLGGALLISLIYLNLLLLLGKTAHSFCWWAAGTAGTGLAGIVGLRLAAPTWLAINGAGIAWGVALPLLGWAILARWERDRRALILVGLLLLGSLLVFYELVLAPFTLALFVATGLLLLVLTLKHNFSRHLENIGLLVSLTAGAAWGMWQGRLPRTDDISHYHLYWINELDRLIQQGNLYPRWAIDFSWGQGSAIFNFYPPLSRYLAESFHLAGMSFNSAIQLTLWLALLFGASGCYFLASELVQDRRGAMLGGLAFCYFPYHLANIYSGGALGHLVAAAMLPWIFWQMTCLFKPRATSFSPFWLGLAGAGLALSNNPQLLLFVPIAGLYLLGLIIIEWQGGRLDWRRTGSRLIIAALIAIGLSGFFLLPAIFESSQVSLIYAGANLEGDSAFYARWPTNLALWQPIYPNLTEINRLFGTLHYGLAGAGLLVWLLRRNSARPHLILLALVVAFTFFLQFPVSSFFWQTFPALASVQFSSRLMPLGVVLAAPLIAGLASSNKSKKYPLVIGSIGLAAVGLMLYACFYSLSYAYWPLSFTGAISQKALTEQITNGDVMYLPKGIENLDKVSKFRPPTFDDNRPTGTTDRLDWKTNGTASFQLTALVSHPATVTLPLFWFEDWWKATDEQGQKYEMTATPQTRLTVLHLPPGEHLITLNLQDTPIKFIGNFLTIVTILVLCGYVLYRRVRPR